MQQTMRRAARAALGLAVLFGGQGTWAAILQPFYLPGQSDYTCYVGDPVVGAEACGSKPLNVQVVVVLNTAGAASACLAVLPYNTLRILYNGKKGKGSLVWRLPASTAQGDAVWFEQGMAIAAPNIGTKDKTFKNDGQVTGLDFSIDLRDGNSSSPANRTRVSYSHMPMVYFIDKASGNRFDCQGVDPIIINSEN